MLKPPIRGIESHKSHTVLIYQEEGDTNAITPIAAIGGGCGDLFLCELLELCGLLELFKFSS